jgi:hypothetical protein
MDSVRTATYSNAAPLIVQLNLRRTAITKSPGQTGTGAKFNGAPAESSWRRNTPPAIASMQTTCQSQKREASAGPPTKTRPGEYDRDPSESE